MPRNPRPRKYKIGNPVIWKSYTDGTEHPCEIAGYPELEPDDDYDQVVNGPLYEVDFGQGKHRAQVAEADLLPWPAASLEVVRENPDGT